MAATSHDFWLHNLSPRIWKALHMMVYVAYAMLVLHVMLGVVQLEHSPVGIGMVGLGMVAVVGLHLRAAQISRSSEDDGSETAPDGFVKVCAVEDIAENRAKTVLIDGQNIAIFKYEGKLSAVSNICRHQNGPLGEGKIVDGCITCPWHGYQYRPADGRAPAPFTEKLETYDLKVMRGYVYVHPNPYPEGTERPPTEVV